LSRGIPEASACAEAGSVGRRYRSSTWSAVIARNRLIQRIKKTEAFRLRFSVGRFARIKIYLAPLARAPSPADHSTPKTRVPYFSPTLREVGIQPLRCPSRPQRQIPDLRQNARHLHSIQ